MENPFEPGSCASNQQRRPRFSRLVRIRINAPIAALSIAAHS